MIGDRCRRPNLIKNDSARKGDHTMVQEFSTLEELAVTLWLFQIGLFSQ